MKVSDVLNEMTSSEYTEWVAYFTLKAEEIKELQRKASVR